MIYFYILKNFKIFQTISVYRDLIRQALFEKQFANDPKVLEVLLQFYLKSGNCMILDHIEMSISCSSAV